MVGEKQPFVRCRPLAKGGRALSVLLPLILVSILAFAASASAQGSDICAQYPDLPQCVEPIDDGGDNDLGNGGGAGGGSLGSGGGGGGTLAGSSGDAGAELPFTGYPLSPVVLICLILLVAGITARAGLAIRERRRAAASATGSPPA